MPSWPSCIWSSTLCHRWQARWFCCWLGWVLLLAIWQSTSFPTAIEWFDWIPSRFPLPFIPLTLVASAFGASPLGGRILTTDYYPLITIAYCTCYHTRLHPHRCHSVHHLHCSCPICGHDFPSLVVVRARVVRFASWPRAVSFGRTASGSFLECNQSSPFPTTYLCTWLASWTSRDMGTYPHNSSAPAPKWSLYGSKYQLPCPDTL